MSIKYKGLPDIDSAPDIFETPDEPEVALRPNEYDLEDEEAPRRPVSENIDSTGLPDRLRAERAFGRRRRKDGRAKTLAAGLYRSDSSSSDTPGPSAARETPAARLRRLKAELAEVERELANGPTASSIQGEESRKRKSVLPPKPPRDLLGEVGKLRDRLEVTESVSKAEPGEETGAGSSGVSSRLAALRLLERPDVDLPASGADTLGEGSGQTRTGQPGLPLSDIDERLAQLEAAVGISTEAVEQHPSPLLSTMAKLDHLLLLLTQPRHLDAISRRVKLLLVDLDRATAASRRAGPGSAIAPAAAPAASSPTLTQAEYTQLQSLFTILPRLDPLLPILPPLLVRLRSLAGLHDEAEAMATALKALQGDEKGMKDEFKDLQDTVMSIQDGLAGSVDGIEKNWLGLQGRLGDLEKRIKELQ